MLERGGIQERLERRSGLTPAAAGAIELRLPEIAAADEREDVAGARIDRHQRRLELGVVEPAQPVGHGALGRVLQLRNERRAHLPVGRMIAAELVAELLTQELLRVAAARLGRARDTARMRIRAARAACSCASVMKPSSRMRVSTTWLRSIAPSRFVHGDSADGARASPAISAHSARFSCLRRPAEQVPRHRLDAVDAGAQINAIEIQLENLLLRQLGVDHQRERRFADSCGRSDFLFDRNSVRASCCVSVLPPSTAPGARMSRHTRAAERDRIDAEMMVEAMILDGDERMLQVGGMSASGTSWRRSSIRNQRPAVGGEEPGVADAAAQLVDGPGLPQRPHDARPRS